MIQMLGNARNLKQSDSALMLSFAAGDQEGFEVLYRRHSASVYRFFYFGTHGDELLAAELFEDVWVTVVRGRVRYTNEITFTDWLYHSAWARLHDHLRLHLLDRNIDDTDNVESSVVSIDAFRPQTQKDALTDETSDIGNNTDTQNSEFEDQTEPAGEKHQPSNAALLTCISEMSPEHKEVVLLRFCFSMNNQEIADFLDVGKSLVDRAYGEAVKMIRSDLDTASGCRS